MCSLNSNDPRRSGSFGPTSSALSSLSLSGATFAQIDDGFESETVSQAGDIGDRALSEGSNRHFSFDNMVENGVVPLAHEAILQPFGTGYPNSMPLNTASPLSTDPILPHADKSQNDNQRLPLFLEYISCLVHLAVFGILGVLTRYLLQKLFGPGVAGVTSDLTILYLDLPSNMVGSFLMGWLGVVFKGDIANVSDELAVGLTTGYLGSLTTFSGWNQKMLDLSAKGKWVSSILGYLIGLFLAAYSIIFGVETAKGFRWLLKRRGTNLRKNTTSHGGVMQRLVVLVILMWILVLLWCISIALEKKEFKNGGSGAQLWLACIVGPLGVWIRWLLARLNGRGLGGSGLFKWVPFGTLIANVAAASLMAALSTVKAVVKTQNCNTITTGIQFGLLGCLSTVSTFIAEFNAMRESNHPWRAYAYAGITIVYSFILGALIYSVPVATKGLN